jgi:hypothetical protein
MRQTAILAGLCLWGVAAFAADPALLNLVMPNAKVLAGVNVAATKNSPFGKFILGRIAAYRRPSPGFFDPLTDATEYLLAINADPSSPELLVFASGTFSPARIAATAANRADLEVRTYDGDTLIVTTNPQAKVVRAVAFIGVSIALTGDVTDVKAALDRSTTVNSIDPALAAEVNTLSANNDVWVASLVGLPGRKMQALQAIQSFNGGLKFGANVTGNAQAVANSPQNAAALASVIQLMATAAKNPVPQSVQVSAVDSAVNLSLTLSEAQAEAQVDALTNGLAALRRQARPSGQVPQSAR